MINKIQRYLQVHYPLIWNIRLVPVILILLGLHILLLGIGYLSVDSSFDQTYYSNPVYDNELLYVFSSLIAILMLIGWLIYYMRNNAFRNFYPRKTHQLYGEWIMCFVICAMIVMLPASLGSGSVMHWCSVTSQSKAEKILDMLDDVEMLMPNASSSNYDYDNEVDVPIPLSDVDEKNIDRLNLDNYVVDYTSSGDIKVRGFKGASLLFYKGSYSSKYYNTDTEYRAAAISEQARINVVKLWLKNGQADSIKALMNSFIELAKKHNLELELTADTWYKRINNPPYFAVNNINKIGRSQYDKSYNYEYRRVFDPASKEYYIINDNQDTVMVGDDEATAQLYSDVLHSPWLPHAELRSAYSRVLSCHEDSGDIHYMYLICLSMALWLSVFVFSGRVTSGRSWLIAFVATGVLIFVVSLFCVFVAISSANESPILLFLSFWLMLFISIVIYLIGKVNNRNNKGRSNPLVNMMCWLVPCVVPFIYLFYVAASSSSWHNSTYYSHPEDYIPLMFWINIPLVVVAMWFVIVLLRKWKSLPEE